MKAFATVLAGALVFAILVFLSESVHAPSPEIADEHAPIRPTPTPQVEAQSATVAERAQVSVSKSQPAMRHDQEELPIAQPGEASVDLQVEQAISVALMKATDGQWQVKFFAEETGKHNALSDSADFWIAIYPELDRLVANGCVERVIERRPPPDKDGGQIPTNCCVNSLVGDVLTVRVCSDEWMVRLTFRENDRMPAKQLFEKVLSAPASSKRKETR